MRHFVVGPYDDDLQCIGAMIGPCKLTDFSC